MHSIVDSIAELRRELGEPDAPLEDPPVLVWADLLLRLALRHGGTLKLLPAEDDSLRVVVGDRELPRVSWTGSALSRFFVLAGLEKGEEARSKPQASSRVIDIGGASVEISARTVPLRAWREEIHVELRPR